MRRDLSDRYLPSRSHQVLSYVKVKPAEFASRFVYLFNLYVVEVDVDVLVPVDSLVVVKDAQGVEQLVHHKGGRPKKMIFEMHSFSLSFSISLPLCLCINLSIYLPILSLMIKLLKN